LSEKKKTDKKLKDFSENSEFLSVDLFRDMRSGCWAEADWDQKASATIHTKKNIKIPPTGPFF
jgi:hypothetical protein